MQFLDDVVKEGLQGVFDGSLRRISRGKPRGAIQVLRNVDGMGVSHFFWKKRYYGVRFNVTSVEKKRCLTLE